MNEGGRFENGGNNDDKSTDSEYEVDNDDVKDSFDDAGLQWWLLHLWCILEEEEIRKLHQEAQREKSA